MAYASKIKFLGYGFYKSREGFGLRVHRKAQEKMRNRVKELTSRRTVNDYEGWKKTETLCGLMGQLLQIGRHETTTDEPR